MGRGRGARDRQAGGLPRERRPADLPVALTGIPYRGRLYHGTTRRRAERIRQTGFEAHGGVVFLTTSPDLAGDYADGEVLAVDVEIANPLVLEGGSGFLPGLREHVPDAPVPLGGDLGLATISRLRALGFDGIVTRYPADERDASDPQPQRDIVRALAGARLAP